MARQLNPQKIADKYVAGMQGAAQAYKDGIDSVQESPTAKAARNLDKAKINYAASIDSGKMAARLLAVSNDQWKQLAKTKGANNLAAGALAAKPKMLAYWNQVAPDVMALQSRIDQMANNTPQDSEQRMLEWSRGMRQIAASRA